MNINELIDSERNKKWKPEKEQNWNGDVKFQKFSEVDWDAMTESNLIENLICFHVTEMHFVKTTPDFLIWARQKFNNDRKFKLTPDKIENQIWQFRTSGYQVAPDPLSIVQVEFVP